MEKLNNLVNYVNKYAGKMEQRTPEWYAARTKTVGGSEIATIIGENAFDTQTRAMQKLFNSKIRGTGYEDKNALFEGNVYTRWGTIFEPMIEEYIEQKYGNDIYGQNIFIYDHDNPVSYSPDGFIMLPDGRIALLEFKCPFGARSIKKIPKYYMPQMLYGLDKTREVTDCGVFIQAVYRPASLATLCENNGKHLWKVPAARNAKNLQCGIIGFVRNEDEEEMAVRGDFTEHEDFKNIFNSYAKTCDKIYAVAEYETDTVADLVECINEQVLEGQQLMGYFGWKLVQVSEIEVAREDGYIEKHLNRITEFVDDVNLFILDEEKRTEIADKYAELPIDVEQCI